MRHATKLMRGTLAIGHSLEFIAGEPDRPATGSRWWLHHGRRSGSPKPWGGVHRLGQHSYRWWAETGDRRRYAGGKTTTLVAAKAAAKKAAGYRARAPERPRPSFGEALVVGSASQLAAAMLLGRGVR